MTPCGKKTTSGRLLGCVIFFPRLTHVVNRVLDASACINMYCNNERNIMKNQAGSPGFGIQGKSLCICVLCFMLSYCLFFVF